MAGTWVLDDREGQPRDPDGNPTRVRYISDGGDVGVKHVRGPGGVHDVPDNHPAVQALAAMELGVGNGDGWRWAQDAEVIAMYDRHGVPLEDRPEGFQKKVKKARVADEDEEDDDGGEDGEPKAVTTGTSTKAASEPAVPKRATPMPAPEKK